MVLCLLIAHSSDLPAWLPFASAIFSVLLLDQQCMVNIAKQGKCCSAFWHSMHEVGRQVQTA